MHPHDGGAGVLGGPNGPSPEGGIGGSGGGTGGSGGGAGGLMLMPRNFSLNDLTMELSSHLAADRARPYLLSPPSLQPLSLPPSANSMRPELPPACD